MKVPKIEMCPGGPLVSRMAAGLWRLADWGLDDGGTLDLIQANLDLGVTTFDHADIYGDYECEELFGRALALTPSLRDEMQIITKCGIKLLSDKFPDRRVKYYDTSGQHIIASAERSLQMLGTDHIDVLLIHRPDPLMDADEVAIAFERLRSAGKVLHFGVSNFTPWQFELLSSRLDFPLVTNQVELSVLNMEVLHDGTVDQCQEVGISPMAWSPLAGGRLFHQDGEQVHRLRTAMEEIGAELGGASLSQVALAWILAHPARIVPIIGTGRVKRIWEAAEAMALPLSREQWFRIWIASHGRDVP
jgi:predicted oxidoreductase